MYTQLVKLYNGSTTFTAFEQSYQRIGQVM